jgi:lipid-A-disaccharide synthase
MADIFIITGETSGELYGALLAKSIKAMHEDVRICGVGGERMRSEGVELLAGVTGSFGLVEALSSLRELRKTFKKVCDELERKRPSVVVLIDFPEFNLKVAERARSLGSKVLYYVSPQVWAWRRGRIKKVRDLSDKIAVILPFEEQLYNNAGVDCEFVGHPIMEEIEHMEGSRESMKEGFGLDPHRGVLGLLPVSRRHELRRTIPLFIRVLRSFGEKYPAYQYILPLAHNVDLSLSEGMLGEIEALGVKIINGRAPEVLRASDMTLVASGTATLQAALIGVPMVVVYKLFPLTYLVGKMVVKVRHISLVNLLADREIVSELIQGKARPDYILRELEKIIVDSQWRSSMLENFQKIRSLYSGKSASQRVAEIVGELASW